MWQQLVASLHFPDCRKGTIVWHTGYFDRKTPSSLEIQPSDQHSVASKSHRPRCYFFDCQQCLRPVPSKILEVQRWRIRLLLSASIGVMFWVGRSRFCNGWMSVTCGDFPQHSIDLNIIDPIAPPMVYDRPKVIAYPATGEVTSATFNSGKVDRWGVGRDDRDLRVGLGDRILLAVLGWVRSSKLSVNLS